MATTVTTTLKELKQSTAPLTRLVRFFAKYPPSEYSALATGQAIPTTKQRVSMGMKPLSSTTVPRRSKSIPNTPITNQDTDSGSLDPELSDAITQLQETEQSTESGSVSFPPNPFLPYRNPETGRWRGARVGLRQQADLYKYAREHGVEELLPPSIKSSAYKQSRALERGLAIRGTGEGQKVKGHKWERVMAGTLEKRRKAMEGMPELIRDWEQKGHGRAWKKYPSK